MHSQIPEDYIISFKPRVYKARFSLSLALYHSLCAAVGISTAKRARGLQRSQSRWICALHHNPVNRNPDKHFAPPAAPSEC